MSPKDKASVISVIVFPSSHFLPAHHNRGIQQTTNRMDHSMTNTIDQTTHHTGRNPVLMSTRGSGVQIAGAPAADIAAVVARAREPVLKSVFGG
jgi:hypothetical protein